MTVLTASLRPYSSRPFNNFVRTKRTFYPLRANVPNGETYRGNSQKINSAHIHRLDRPWCETNHDILRLAEYRFIYEKIDNNRILSKCRFPCSKFKKNLEASRHKMKQPRPIKTIKS